MIVNPRIVGRLGLRAGTLRTALTGLCATVALGCLPAGRSEVVIGIAAALRLDPERVVDAMKELSSFIRERAVASVAQGLCAIAGRC